KHRDLGVTTRARAGLAVHAAAALALIPAYILLAPDSDWSDPGLLAVLAALAIIAVRHDVPLPSGIAFDATVALALIAVALVGPLAAFAVIFPPIAVNALSGREQLLRAGNLANLAAYGWYTLAGGIVLTAADVEPGTTAAFLALCATGCVLLVVNFAVGPLIYATMWIGHPLRSVARMFPDGLPAGLAMTTLGALTVVLYEQVGLLALAVFALVAVLPQSALTFVARTRPVGQLDPLTATRRYAHALCMQLDVGGTDRRLVDDVVRTAHERGVSGDPAEHLGHAVVDWSEASCAAGHVTEWWNGAGGPAGLPGRLIPLPARIAAVAQTWASLTAEGSPRLSHVQALAHLESTAGVRLDPAVVKAVAAVIGQERASADVPAPEPRMHRLHVPAPVRRMLAAG
ncbi:MAG: HD domain-containing phosphohydrolase, partial [Solirubrobacteraceae bacterium]